MKVVPFILSSLLLAGCLAAPADPTGLPGTGLTAYPWQGAEHALQIMAARDARLTSARLSGTLALEESPERSVILEAVLVMETRPGQTPKLRLQAKKLGHLAFDLTLNETGVWLVDGREHADGQPDENRGMAQMAQGLRRLSGGRLWRRAQVRQEQTDTFTAALDDAGRASATIHKAALVPLSFDFATPDGPVHLRLEHAPAAAPDGGVFPLPCKWAATAPHGRRFSFEARKVEANPALPAAVFTPPKNALQLKSE